MWGVRVCRNEYCCGLGDEEVVYKDCIFLVTWTEGEIPGEEHFLGTYDDFTFAHRVIERSIGSIYSGLEYRNKRL